MNELLVIIGRFLAVLVAKDIISDKDKPKIDEPITRQER